MKCTVYIKKDNNIRDKHQVGKYMKILFKFEFAFIFPLTPILQYKHKLFDYNMFSNDIFFCFSVFRVHITPTYYLLTTPNTVADLRPSLKTFINA